MIILAVLPPLWQIHNIAGRIESDKFLRLYVKKEVKFHFVAVIWCMELF